MKARVDPWQCGTYSTYQTTHAAVDDKIHHVGPQVSLATAVTARLQHPTHQNRGTRLCTADNQPWPKIKNDECSMLPWCYSYTMTMTSLCCSYADFKSALVLLLRLAV